MLEEMRQHERIPANKDTTIFLADYPGKLVNISKGGLAFDLVNYDDLMSHDRVISIMSNDTFYYVSNIPCWLVYQNKKKPFSEGNLINTKRYGIQFAQINEVMKKEIDFIISTIS